MRPVALYECQKCFELHLTQEGAQSCHDDDWRKVYVCAHCEIRYEDYTIAQRCGMLGAGPSKVNLESFEDMEIDDE